MKKRVSLLLLPFLAAGALAQDALQEDAQAEARRYTVEMIIFAYAQNVSAGGEVFVPDLPPIELAEEPLLEAPAPVPAPVAVDARKRNRYDVVMLRREDFGLRNAYGHLRRLDAYRPLAHFGWTQTTYPDAEVEARPLSAFITPPQGLEGDLTLYLSRYLHLAVNLQLDAPGSDPVYYRIDEDRIFRSGELRYFDHPKFGVLAKITRAEAQEPENGELLGDGEMLGD